METIKTLSGSTISISNLPQAPKAPALTVYNVDGVNVLAYSEAHAKRIVRA